MPLILICSTGLLTKTLIPILNVYYILTRYINTSFVTIIQNKLDRSQLDTSLFTKIGAIVEYHLLICRACWFRAGDTIWKTLYFSPKMRFSYLYGLV